MNTLVKIAWRNLWRNKRRTFITIASVFLAVVLALFTRSMQFGSYNMMIDVSIKEVGHLQIHDSGYWENQSINNSFILTEQIKQKITQNKDIEDFRPRLESFALGSYGDLTKGLLVQGIDPALEDKYKNISGNIVKGRFIESNDKGIILAEGLANYFKIDINDSIVLLGQGYQGITAAGVFPVAGIVKYGSPKINNLLVYMGIETARETFSPYFPHLLNSVLINVKNRKNLEKIVSSLKKELGSGYEVMGWDEMLKDVVQQIQADNAGGKVMLAILYIIVTFGIFGTILMMTMERRKEFSIMIAVGMQRGKLAWIVLTETLFIGIIGVVCGIIASFPALHYLYKNPIPLSGETAKLMLEYNLEPIFPFAVDYFIFTNQGIIIFLLATLAALYPVIFINRFKLIKAMKI